MSATIIDGKAEAELLKSEVAKQVEEFTQKFGRPPGLATVLVGQDPASAVYVANKQKTSAELGIRGFAKDLPADISFEDLSKLLVELANDNNVDGILCQLPLPAHLDEVAVTGLIPPSKDVDGLTEGSAGKLALGKPGLRPCTPAGVLRLLKQQEGDLTGASAVVIGRSNLFGKPMAQLLLAEDCTVTTAHSKTKDLAAVCADADIVIAAVGRPQMVKAEWLKPGAIVIDVGINRTEVGLVGDVDFDAAQEIAAAITPVPGGVGPMTIAMLMANTVQAARERAEQA